MHWVHVGTNGYAVVKPLASGYGPAAARLGCVSNPQAAGEAWLEQQGRKAEGERMKGEILEYVRVLERRVKELEAEVEKGGCSSVPDDVIAALTVMMSEKGVQAAYRVRAKEVHPDKGGDASAFRALGEARDTCLRWIKSLG